MICPRCLKSLPDEPAGASIHTCTPSKLVRELEQQRDEYRDTIAQQAELLAAHKDEMQDWQRQMLSAQQQRDEYRDTIAQQAELLAAHKDEVQDWQRQLLAAQQERDEYKKDAERYRYMRSHALFEWRNGPGLYWYLPRTDRDMPYPERLDKEIDAAMKEQK